MGIKLEKSSRRRLLQAIYERVVGGGSCLTAINEFQNTAEIKNRVCVSGRHYVLMFESQEVTNALNDEFGNVFTPEVNEREKYYELFELMVNEKIGDLLECDDQPSPSLNYFQILGDTSFIVGLSFEILSQNFLKTYSTSLGIDINRKKVISLCDKMNVSLDLILNGISLEVNDLISLEVGSTITSNVFIKDGLNLYHEGKSIANQIFISNNDEIKIIVG
ncbi:hypothetical protein AB6C48_05230 [Vibrio splendidus]